MKLYQFTDKSKIKTNNREAYYFTFHSGKIDEDGVFSGGIEVGARLGTCFWFKIRFTEIKEVR